MALVADARIDNREELIHALRLPRAAAPTDADLILQAYKRWGESAAQHLLGDFAYAVWDPRERALVCARDPMGVRPFYFHRSARVFAFASEAKALLLLPGVSRELDAEQVGRFLDISVDHRDRTLYSEILRLPAAHTLRISPKGVTTREYWRLDPQREIRFRDSAQYAEAFRELFTDAVRSRMRSAYPIGTTLSGGLDSSAIACTARQLRADRSAPLHTFSLIFPDLPADELALIDERQYVSSVVSGGDVHPHFVRGDLLSPLREVGRVLERLDEPHFGPNLYLHWGMFEAAQGAGVRVLLDGFDGDTTVSHGLGRLNELLCAGEWNEFEGESRAFAKHRGISVNSVLNYYGLPYLDDLARRHQWLQWTRAGAQLARRFGISRREILVRHGIRPAVPASIRSGVRRFRRTDATPPSVVRRDLRRLAAESVASVRQRAWGTAISTERESHSRGLTQPLYQLALEYADKAAAGFGVEPRYPFFDRRLMEFCVAIPADEKFAGGWSRLVFRKAMEGVLPRDIQWRINKANLSPNFYRALRSRDDHVLGRIDFGALHSYADASRLGDIRRRYLEDAGIAEEDVLLLYRSAILALWLSEHWGNRPSNEPCRTGAPVGDGVLA